MTILDGAFRIGDHVILDDGPLHTGGKREGGGVGGFVHMRRCITIGADRARARYAVVVDQIRAFNQPAQHRTVEEVRAQCVVVGNHPVPRLLDVLIAAAADADAAAAAVPKKRGRGVKRSTPPPTPTPTPECDDFAIVEVTPGVTLHDVIVQTEAQGALLDAPTCLHALLVATRAANAARTSSSSSSQPPVPPYMDAKAIRLGFDGAVVFLGHLTGWPAPNRDAMHTWVGLQYLVERLTDPLQSLELRDCLAWMRSLGREPTWSSERWSEAADTFARAFARAAADADVPSSRFPPVGQGVGAERIAGLVRELFPDAHRREVERTDELAMIDDDMLRAIVDVRGASA